LVGGNCKKISSKVNLAKGSGYLARRSKNVNKVAEARSIQFLENPKSRSLPVRTFKQSL
jgi:hypothetical protein